MTTKHVATIIDHKNKEIVTVDQKPSGEVVMHRDTLKQGKRVDDYLAHHVRRAEATK